MENDKHYATVVLDESLSPVIPGSDSVRRNSKDSGLSSPGWPDPCPSSAELTSFGLGIPTWPETWAQLSCNVGKSDKLRYLLPNDGVTVNTFKGFLRVLVSD